MFKQLKDLIQKPVNKHGLKSEFEALSVINEYKKYCREIIGDDAVTNLVPRFYKNKTLYIDAKNASWAQHLHIHRTEILKKMNKSLGEKTVIKFSINIQNKT
jgi:hypothetical protein